MEEADAQACSRNQVGISREFFREAGRTLYLQIGTPVSASMDAFSPFVRSYLLTIRITCLLLLSNYIYADKPGGLSG